MYWIRHASWPLIGILCLTLGLMPYTPMPHVAEKIGMLFAGELSRPIDIFDLVLHGFPWLLAIFRATIMLAERRKAPSPPNP